MSTDIQFKKSSTANGIVKTTKRRIQMQHKIVSKFPPVYCESRLCYHRDTKLSAKSFLDPEGNNPLQIKRGLPKNTLLNCHVQLKTSTPQNNFNFITFSKTNKENFNPYW